MKICNNCGQPKEKGKRCKPCWAAYMRDHNAKNKEKTRARHKKYKIQNPEKYKDSQLKYTYNISLDEYTDLLEAQNYGCAVCHQKETAINYRSGDIKMLAVDHDHSTGKVRGLLCQKCNQALGLLKDDVVIIQSLLAYIER